MNCEKVREQIPELLAGRLDQAARESVVEHLESCAACRSEVAELNTVWRGMENLNDPAQSSPDPAAKARFLEVLHAYQAGMGVQPPAPKGRLIAFPQHPVWRAALAAGLLIGGVFLGRYQLQPQTGPEVAQLKGQVEGLRQMVALSMLQQTSPSARMRGVTYTEQMSQPDREVAEALLYAVKNDTNMNVRLSAVDALQKFASDPRVAPAMIEAIPGQESPLVQIALIDMLVQLSARSALPDLRRLAKDPQLDEMVRQRAAWAVQQMEGTR
jgi:HEAT repeat protein